MKLPFLSILVGTSAILAQSHIAFAATDCNNDGATLFEVSDGSFQCNDLGLNIGYCKETDLITGTSVSNVCGRQCKAVMSNGCEPIYHCSNDAKGAIQWGSTPKTCSNVLNRSTNKRCNKVDRLTGLKVAEVCGIECQSISSCPTNAPTPFPTEFPTPAPTDMPTPFPSEQPSIAQETMVTVTVEVIFNYYQDPKIYEVMDLLANDEVVWSFDIGSIPAGTTVTFQQMLPSSCYGSNTLNDLDEYIGYFSVEYEDLLSGGALWSAFSGGLGPNVGPGFQFGFEEDICGFF